MSYIFNIVDFRLSPLLQDFPYFDICWTRIPVIPSMKQNYWGMKHKHILAKSFTARFSMALE